MSNIAKPYVQPIYIGIMGLSNRPTLSIARTFIQNLSYAASLAYVCGKRLDKVGRLDKNMNSKEKNPSNLP